LYPRPESCRVKVNGAIYPDPAKGVSLADLALAFARVLEAQAKGRAVPVPQTKVSVAEKIDALRRLFTRRHRLTFDSLFRRRRSRPEMIATFLALLELVRQGVLMAQQEVSTGRSEEHTSELQSRENLVCRLLLEKKKTRRKDDTRTLR